MPNTGEITPQEQTGISSNGNLTFIKLSPKRARFL